MKKLFFTITGCTYRYGLAFFKPGLTVTLIKEPNNKYDREAIRAELEGLGTVGYVANSPHTVRGVSMSAGRLYDKIGKVTSAAVVYVLSDSVICSIDSENGQLSAGMEEFPETMSQDEEAFLFPDAQDLDLYSQENTDYLLSTEEEEPSIENLRDKGFQFKEDEEEPAADYTENAFEESAEADWKTPLTDAETVTDEVTDASMETENEEPSEETGTAPDPAEETPAAKTLSAEEIASALTAALSGLTIDGNHSSEDDPDSEYIYGNRTPAIPAEQIGSILSDEPGGITAENIQAVLSSGSGFSPADFINVLTGGAETSADTEIPVSDHQDTAEADDFPEDYTTSADTSDSVIYKQEEYTSHTPGLNFNSARFPEEEDGYTAPPAAAQEDNAAAIPQNPEDTAAAPSLQTKEPDETADPPSAETEDPAEIPVPETIILKEDTLSDYSEAGQDAGPAGGSAPESNAVSSDNSEEEDEDDVSQPFVYDKSELDENLAKLHLENIDATYLSDSFLENLRNKLKENS